MAYTYNEKKTLKKLGISDFRQMSRDKVTQFATMLPEMDPEVAKVALAQFPKFVEFSTDMLQELKNMVDKGFEQGKESQKAFSDACNTILTSLQTELVKEDLPKDEKELVINKMLEVAKMLSAKDTENKKLEESITRLVSGTLLFVLGTLAAAIGVNILAKPNEKDDEPTNDEEIDAIDGEYEEIYGDNLTSS